MIRSSASPAFTVNPLSSIAVACRPSRTVTPSEASPSAALADSFSLKAGTTRSPASTRITLAFVVSIREKSCRRPWAMIASDPACLDPRRAAADDGERQPLLPGGWVGGPLGLLEGGEDLVAQPDDVARVFRPKVTSFHSSLPKYEVSAPQARIRLS